MSAVYYRLYFSRREVVTVVEMQAHDEDDYIESCFIPDIDGNRMQFDSEDQAVAHLNARFQDEHIDEQYKRGDSHDWVKNMEREGWRNQ